MIQVRLDLPPSTNRIWRNNAGRVHKSTEYTAWRTAAAWTIRQAAMQQSPVLGPFDLHIEAGRPDKRKRDLDNFTFKPVLDALVIGGAIRDDSDAQSLFARWVPDLKGVRVTITPAGGL